MIKCKKHLKCSIEHYSVPRSTVLVSAGGRHVVWRTSGNKQRSRARERARPGLLLMATAPWEASEELNEFPPQLKWSSRGQSDRTPPVPRDRQQARRHWQDPVVAHYMETHSQVCLLASPLAVSWRLERFLTHLYDVAVRRAPTPCLPSFAETKWGGVVGVILFFISGCPTHRRLWTYPCFLPWLREPPPGC